MKTTLNIDGHLMATVKQEAARQGCTMSEFIESALRLALQGHRRRSKLTALPTFSGGPFRANIADHDGGAMMFVSDLHVAALMREHGIATIYTRDVDFDRFPSLRVLDPMV